MASSCRIWPTWRGSDRYRLFKWSSASAKRCVHPSMALHTSRSHTRMPARSWRQQLRSLEAAAPSALSFFRVVLASSSSFRIVPRSLECSCTDLLAVAAVLKISPSNADAAFVAATSVDIVVLLLLLLLLLVPNDLLLPLPLLCRLACGLLSRESLLLRRTIRVLQEAMSAWRGGNLALIFSWRLEQP